MLQSKEAKHFYTKVSKRMHDNEMLQKNECDDINLTLEHLINKRCKLILLSIAELAPGLVKFVWLLNDKRFNSSLIIKGYFKQKKNIVV
jgi:hypothetical protein